MLAANLLEAFCKRNSLLAFFETCKGFAHSSPIILLCLQGLKGR